MINKQPKQAYDYSLETDIQWLHHGKPAYLRETVCKMLPTANDYYRPSIQAHADIWGFSLSSVPHNMPRKVRVFFLLDDAKDGHDVRKIPRNPYGLDRQVAPDSIEAGKPSRPCRPQKPDRHARRILKQRRIYNARKNEFFDNGARWLSKWQKLKRWFGVK